MEMYQQIIALLDLCIFGLFILIIIKALTLINKNKK
jgi:hypothetical protein